MNRIERILKEKRMTKAALAERMGTSRQNVSALLKNPSKSKMEEIAHALEVPIWELFDSYDDYCQDSVLTAMIEYKGKLYKATSLSELKELLSSWN